MALRNKQIDMGTKNIYENSLVSVNDLHCSAKTLLGNGLLGVSYKFQTCKNYKDNNILINTMMLLQKKKIAL